MDDQTALHNKLAPELVRALIKAVDDSGGTYLDALVVLESVVFGVVAVAPKFGFTRCDEVLDEMCEHVQERLKARADVA